MNNNYYYPYTTLKRWVLRWRLKTLTHQKKLIIIIHQYAPLKRYVLRWRLKILVMARISWGSEFQSFGVATWNDLSPNVTFVLIDGAASKIPLVERKLYAPYDFRRTRSWMQRGAMPCIALNVNSNTLKWIRCLNGSQLAMQISH